MTPLQTAARNAWDEAGRLRDELGTLAPLSGETGSSNRVAWETYRAWERAVQRAQQAQKLADDDAGVFNAFDEVTA